MIQRSVRCAEEDECANRVVQGSEVRLSTPFAMSSDVHLFQETASEAVPNEDYWHVGAFLSLSFLNDLLNEIRDIGFVGFESK